MADYPLPVFLAVLGSAVLHAAWNAVIRSGADRMLHTGAIVFWTGVIALPVLWFVAPPAPESWGFLAISNVVHMLYYVALASAYRTGNLSFAYPLIRGMAPLMVALGGLLGGDPAGLRRGLADRLSLARERDEGNRTVVVAVRRDHRRVFAI